MNGPSYEQIIHMFSFYALCTPGGESLYLPDVAVTCMGCGKGPLDMTQAEAWHGLYCLGDYTTRTVEAFVLLWHCRDCEPHEILKRFTDRPAWPRTPTETWQLMQGTSL